MSDQFVILDVKTEDSKLAEDFFRLFTELKEEDNGIPDFQYKKKNIRVTGVKMAKCKDVGDEYSNRFNKKYNVVLVGEFLDLEGDSENESE